MQLFYNLDLNEHTNEISFSKEESKHISKVLRKKEGDSLYITNGKGWLFIATIISVSFKACTAKIVSKTFQKKKAYTLHLAVAPTKLNDRYEWFLEKATEIGIDSITPIICDHSERKFIKAARFNKILQSAMKQSLNYYLPILHPEVSFKEYLSQSFKGQRYIAHCKTDTTRNSIKQVLLPQQEVTIVIGPEGDFSDKEIDLAVSKAFLPITLGTTRLRTETAAIVAAHSVAFMNE